MSVVAEYNKKYGEPKSEMMELQNLEEIFMSIMGFHFLHDDVIDGIKENHRVLSDRNLPAYEWMVEAMHITSKKGRDKRSFGYVVGILRSWMTKGFGYIPNQEEDDIAEIFNEVTGMDMSESARHLLHTLMGRYGVIKITRAIAKMEREADFSLLLMSTIEDQMEDMYGMGNTIETDIADIKVG